MRVLRAATFKMQPFFGILAQPSMDSADFTDKRGSGEPVCLSDAAAAAASMQSNVNPTKLMEISNGESHSPCHISARLLLHYPLRRVACLGKCTVMSFWLFDTLQWSKIWVWEQSI